MKFLFCFLVMVLSLCLGSEPWNCGPSTYNSSHTWVLKPLLLDTCILLDVRSFHLSSNYNCNSQTRLVYRVIRMNQVQWLYLAHKFGKCVHWSEDWTRQLIRSPLLVPMVEGRWQLCLPNINLFALLYNMYPINYLFYLHCSIWMLLTFLFNKLILESNLAIVFLATCLSVGGTDWSGGTCTRVLCGF